MKVRWMDGDGVKFWGKFGMRRRGALPFAPFSSKWCQYKMLLKSKLNVRDAFEEVPFQYNHSGEKESRLMETFRVRLEEKWSLQRAQYVW